MNYTEPFLRKVETAQEEQQHQHPQHHHHHPQSGVSYRAAVAAKNILCIVAYASVKWDKFGQRTTSDTNKNRIYFCY